MGTDIAALLADYKSISIVGMCKNAGKTTALGRMLASCAHERVGLSSIGRDGESSDLVTGTEKPAVFVSAGTLFATAAYLIPLCTVSRTILSLSDYATPLGRVAILRADSAGAVQIAGPSTTAQMTRIAEDMRAFGAERVFIDGAIFRRSIANPALCDAVVLSTGAAYHADMQKTVTDTEFLCTLMTLPVYDGEPNARMLSGALTSKLADSLISEGVGAAVIADPSRALINQADYARFTRRGIRLYVEARPTLLFVTANPYSPYGAGYEQEAFLAALRARLPVPVLDAKKEALC